MSRENEELGANGRTRVGDTAWAMSQENVEIARRSLSEFAATQQPTGYEAPDFVWDLRHFRDWPGAEEFHGSEEFMQDFFTTWVAPYDEWSVEGEQFWDAGEKGVVVAVRQRGRLGEGWVEALYGAVYFFNDEGQIQRMTWYSSPAEALEAVGLRE